VSLRALPGTRPWSWRSRCPRVWRPASLGCLPLAGSLSHCAPPSWDDSWQSSPPPAETAPPLAAKGRFNADAGCRRTRVLFAGGLLRRSEALPSARARSSGSFQGNHPADVAPVLCRAARSIPRSQQRSRVRCELPQAARPRPAAVAKSRLGTPDTATRQRKKTHMTILGFSR